MKFLRLLFVSLVVFLVSNIYSQNESPEVKKIILVDESEFVGTIVNESDEIIYFKTSAGVEIEIKKNLVKKIITISKQSGPMDSKGYRPGDHELLLMPTAKTMKKGQWYFSDYELLFLNFTFAAGENTHIGAFTLFPITSDFLESITLGIKQNYFRNEKFQAAVWGTYTPKASGLTLGNVFSYGGSDASLHIGLSGATGVDDEDSGWEFVYMLGGRVNVSHKVCLMAEYTNFSTAAENGFDGLISFGFRFIGESIAWELGGIRPLEGTGDADFFMVPLLKATVLFD